MKRYLKLLNQWRLYLVQKSLEQLAAWTHKLSTHPCAAKLTRKLSMQKPYRVDIGHPDRVVILLVGCGGTGGYVAHILAQMAVWARSAGIDLRLYFVDHDIIEEKNLARQNFCHAEIGYPKAFSLAWRYTAAFGITITPVVEQFSAELLDRFQPSHSPQGTLTIVIGAVDNVCARRKVAEAITAKLKRPGHHNRLWWVDAGNERVNGQVLAGSSLNPEPQLSPLGYCTDLPLPHIQEPGLLMERDRPQPDLSCADLTLLAEQSAMINRAMATWVGIYLYRLLQSRDLSVMATFVNTEGGVTRSKPITYGQVIKPERRQRVRITTVPTDPEPLACPVCGGELIEGQDEWDGVLITVRFCETCTYREEACPECGAGIGQAQALIEGELTPVIHCQDCDWREPTTEPSAASPPVGAPDREEGREASMEQSGEAPPETALRDA